MSTLSGSGIRRADQLEPGTVAVTVFHGPGDDVGTHYYGPVLTESDTHIRISVWGAPMIAWAKRDCAITRSVHDLALQEKSDE